MKPIADTHVDDCAETVIAMPGLDGAASCAPDRSVPIRRRVTDVGVDHDFRLKAFAGGWRLVARRHLWDCHA